MRQDPETELQTLMDPKQKRESASNQVPMSELRVLIPLFLLLQLAPNSGLPLKPELGHSPQVLAGSCVSAA